MTALTLTWTCRRLEDLAAAEVYALLALRSAVFVVEQNCPFLDADGLDDRSWHLLGRGVDGALDAYLRIVDPGVKYPEPSIGRVITRFDRRGTGLGRRLMEEGMARCRTLWPHLPIRIGAQARLERFYASLGFESVGERYIEDGIDHVEMVLAATSASARRKEHIA